MRLPIYSALTFACVSSTLAAALPRRVSQDENAHGIVADDIVETITNWQTVWWTDGSGAQQTSAVAVPADVFDATSPAASQASVTSPASSSSNPPPTPSSSTLTFVSPSISPSSPAIPSISSSTPQQAPVTASPTPTTSTSPVVTSMTASSSAAQSTPSSQSSKIPFLRGVNLGGWLVLESWMNGDLFTDSFASATDQWSFDSISGAKAALETHWSTFFTEDDVKTIAATGINALRIPIGYWAYDVADGEPYIQGADVYLEQAIGWARDNNMYVWVDLHGSPGSQNGFDNSGHAGNVEWQQDDNLQRSISVLKTIATKYGALEYSDVVVGIEMVNEPISWDNNVFSVSQNWAQEAYAAVKTASASEKLVIVMHDGFEGPVSWTTVAEGLTAGRRFGVDTHLYQLYSDSDNQLTQAQHITEACGWAAELATANAIMPVYAGEWSAATNICVNPDGSTIAGTSCSTAGCQCQSADFSSWNDGMIEQVRRFVEAQLDVFESSSSGYFMWAAKGPGGWGFLNGIGNGAIPNPVTSRKYPGQCGSSARRSRRGELGLIAEPY
ncbi:MAG: hypothetical protein M1818_000188 [Claussenomyces sp. TS43310]|nr:MAG: hypothetical protein M1818_000188 [Claussenomyces sp. TS43310]